MLEHIVIESKGGGSELGTAMFGELRVEQGTKEYFDLIVKKMLTGTTEMQAAAVSLRKAGVEGVKYLKVQVPIESGPVGGAASAVKQVEIGEFELKP